MAVKAVICAPSRHYEAQHSPRELKRNQKFMNHRGAFQLKQNVPIFENRQSLASGGLGLSSGSCWPCDCGPLSIPINKTELVAVPLRRWGRRGPRGTTSGSPTGAAMRGTEPWTSRTRGPTELHVTSAVLPLAPLSLSEYSLANSFDKIKPPISQNLNT